MRLICFQQTCVHVPCFSVIPAFEEDIRLHLRNARLTVLVAVHGGKQRRRRVAFPIFRQLTRLAVRCFLNLRPAVAVIAQRREGIYRIIVISGFQLRLCGVVQGRKIRRMILIRRRKRRVDAAGSIILPRIKRLVRPHLQEAVAAVLIIPQRCKCRIRLVILPGFQQLNGVVIVHFRQDDFRHHKESRRAQCRNQPQNQADSAHLGGVHFRFPAADFFLPRAVLRGNALLFGTFSRFFCRTLRRQAILLRALGGKARRQLLLQLVALRRGSLAVPVVAQFAECRRCLCVLFLLHQPVCRLVGDPAEGFYLCVARGNALRRVGVAMQFFHLRPDMADFLHRRGIMQLHHCQLVCFLHFGLCLALLDCIVRVGQLLFQRLVRKAKRLLVVAALLQRQRRTRQIAFPADSHLRHQLAQIGAGVLEVLIQRLFAEVIRFLPFAVLQRHKCAPNQRLHIRLQRCFHLLHNNLLRRVRLIFARQLLDAVNQILHEAQLAHVLRLQVAELLRQIVRIHILVCGHKGFVRS